jgi:hypothetical protein
MCREELGGGLRKLKCFKIQISNFQIFKFSFLHACQKNDISGRGEGGK